MNVNPKGHRGTATCQHVMSSLTSNFHIKLHEIIYRYGFFHSCYLALHACMSVRVFLCTQEYLTFKEDEMNPEFFKRSGKLCFSRQVHWLAESRVRGRLVKMSQILLCLVPEYERCAEHTSIHLWSVCYHWDIWKGPHVGALIAN